MSTSRKLCVFFVVSVLFTVKLARIYGHSLLQRSSPRSEFNCALTRRELRRFSGSEERRWLVTDVGIEALEGDIQTLVNCTEEGDVLLFDVEAPIQPPRRITIPWNLTLSSFVENPRLANGTFQEATRKVTVLCPRADEGVFLVEANDSLLANFIFRNCSLNYRRGEAAYGIITTANCSTSENMGAIGFHHLEFEANVLNRSAALEVQEPSCSSVQIINVTFQNNSCTGTCAASLVGRTAIQNITLTGNWFFEEDVRTPILIGIRSGSNTTISGLTASGNNGTVVHVRNANVTIRNFHVFQNSGGLNRNGYYTGGVTLLHSSGRILDCHFEENVGYTGPSIAVHNSSSVIRRISVVGCTSTRRGGGISITRSSNVWILDSVIANNSAGLTGGGVYSNGTRNLEIERTTFETNSAEAGGGLYSSYGDVEIASSIFRSNNASEDGAGFYLHNSTITIKDSILVNSRAERFAGGGYILRSSYSLNNLTVMQNGARSAGGLLMYESSGSLNNTLFERNSVRLSGGGVRMEASNVSLVHNCTFFDNSASYGGGIYMDELMFASLLSCHFIRNRVSDSGGGARFENGTYFIDSNIFEENASDELGGGLTCFHSILNVTNTRFRRNIAVASGAGSNVFGNTSAWFASCTWTSNIARIGGGGAFFESVPNVVITNSSFRLNRAQSSGGGAIRCLESSNFTLEDCRFDNNSADASGGSILVSESVAHATNLQFQYNSAEYGGALASYDSTTEVLASNFVFNEVRTDGGAIDCEGSGFLKLEDCSFASNSANRSGGAIIASGSIISATNLRFQNNRASRFGGAVHLQRNTSALLAHFAFFRETSEYRGGALSATETVLRARNISIASCVAVSGGGIYLYLSSGDINDTAVTRCDAVESGGGIRMIESIVSGFGLNISLNVVVGTSQYRPEGGGITIESTSTLSITNATLEGNRAQYGAGIYVTKECIALVSDGYFHNNSARTSGGFAYIEDSSLAVRSVFSVRNSAFYGGTVYGFNSSLTLNDSQLINSSSTDAGGSLLARGGCSVVMKGTTIQSSTAVNGGGIMLDESYFWGVRVQLRNCSARVHGGGLKLNESSSFLCTECLFEGNSALYEGGALRLESLKPQLLAFQLANTIFRDNDAEFGAGIHFQTGDGSANCSDVNSTECTFLALTGCVFTNNDARSVGGAILANNPSAIRISCDPLNKTDPFAYYTHEGFGALREVSSLDAVCDNWKANNASTYGPIVGSYARRVSTSVLLGPNRTVEMQSNRYVLRGRQSGHPLPAILIETVDEFRQGPALVQDNQLIEAVMTSPDGLFAGIFIVRMEDSRGTFSGITGYQSPGNYDIHINFNESSMPTLIIVVEIRHCLIGESIAANGTLCDPCGDSTYNFHPLSSEECTPCPDNANCESVAIRPKKGFWHQTPCSNHVQRCLSERACDEQGRDTRLLALGSSIEDCDFDDEFVSNYSRALCREGYTGPLCGSCSASYGKTRSFRCEECFERFVNLFLVVFVVSILLGLAGFTVRSALPAHRHPATRNRPRREESSSSPVNLQMVEMLCTGRVPQEMIYPHLQRRETNVNTPAAQRQVERNAELAKWKAVEIFKITINYLQVIAIAIAVNVAWTGALIAMFETAEFIGGVTSEAAGRSTDCLISADSLIPRSAVRTIVNLIIPAVVGAIFAVFWAVAMIKNKEGYGYLVKRCLLSALVVNYLSYIAITKTAVNILYCVEVHDSVDFEDDSTTMYWAVDTALKCYDGPHTVLASVFGWPVLIVFSFGFPVLIAYVLTTRRSQEGIQSPWLFEIAGFLYRSYDERFIFWESVILLRKATLAVIVVFAYPLGGNLQGILAVCVLMIALYLHTFCSPYRPEFETLNRLEGLSLLISSLTFVSGLFFNDDRTSSEARATIAAFLILANVGIFTYFSVRFFVAGATYLGIVLENEGVPCSKDATAFHIVKTFLKNKLNMRVDSAVRRFHAFTSRHGEDSITNEV